MRDIDRAIRILENERACCDRTCARTECGECDLVMDTDWLASGLDDAIAELKERRPAQVLVRSCKANQIYCSWIEYSCSACHTVVDIGDKYCRHCGRPLSA